MSQSNLVYNVVQIADASRLSLPSGIGDLFIADLPYAVLTNTAEIKRVGAKAISRFESWDDITLPQYNRLLKSWAAEMFRVAREGATAYVFCSIELMYLIRLHFTRTGWRWHQPQIWHKTNPAPKVRLVSPQSSVEGFGMLTKPVPKRSKSGKIIGYINGHTFHPTNGSDSGRFTETNGGKCHNFFEYPIPHHTARVHPTQKPEGLIGELISRSSNPGDLVIDPFCGSGVSGWMAERLGRKFIISDLSPKYTREAKRLIEVQRDILGSRLL